VATTQFREYVEEPTSSDGSVARGLLRRDDLLQVVDRAVTRRVTVVSAPPGSGKTSLLRAWADRSTSLRRVAFVSVDRDQQDPQRFWSAVLDAIRSPARSIDPEAQPAPTAALDADQLVDRLVSELAEQVEAVVLIIDDLHELKSADASRSSSVCSRFCRALRAWCCRLVGSADQAAQLRLADEVAEIRPAISASLRTRRASCLPRPDQPVGRRGGLVVRAHGRLGGRPALGGDLAQSSRGSERFVAEFSAPIGQLGST